MTDCWIYKGTKKDQTYLYVAQENAFDAVPDALLSAMGELALVLSLELHEQRTLARADVRQVRKELQSKGYYLQLPPVDSAQSPV